VQAMFDLRQCGEMLDKEQALDESMRGQFGEAWVRPPSRVAAASYRENIARYESNLQAAGDSDRSNSTRLAEALPRLQALSVENIRSRMPKLERPMVSPGADVDTVTTNLRQIIAQLEALSQERAVLEEGLKSKREADNVLPNLLKSGADGADKVFEVHLAVFREAGAGVESNVARTNEALSILSQYVAAFSKLYDIDGWQADCTRVGGVRPVPVLGRAAHQLCIGIARMANQCKQLVLIPVRVCLVSVPVRVPSAR
jgi:flagellar biosynthesis/type III secretory pathway chaperone